MSNPTPTPEVSVIRVVSAVILVNGLPEPYLMLTQRDMDRAHPGAWELPGGKVEKNESFGAAMRRELT